ncbi:chromosomal replication initiator protein [Chitinophaga dinghuensis]|uniref:Chromosomal replication initiator protein DnaA n=1 Tax=Chitinophaga dinghuensis TaxID=1539050 RepID=A0A327VNK5_9BACT|nr:MULTISPECIES: chromosomal replication initiator protein DnaA [Chitinophaga]MBV8255263.1 chromosomal replication initiator protein DnaA [Chitinophaga sp.]NIG52973.1 chromosomal replication initiator protein DnaA [Chitinophaga sp. Cy-1792]RAJ75118.1 chromosomal replication initiator protein [Chitinophaga dinghuensis]
MNKTCEQVWERCLNIIRDIVEWQPFKTWFEPIKPIKLENNVLTIQVPSQFFYEYLEEHYVGLLGKTIKRELGKEARLEYRIVVENGTPHQNPRTVNMPTQFTKPQKDNEVDFPLTIQNPVKNPFVIPGIKRVQIDSQLNPNYTFDSYIEGDCNRVARRAGKTVAEKPGGTSFNPLVIYGGVGLGKTHLAQAIGNEVKRIHPNKAVLYVSAEKFINQFIDHSKNNIINDFIHFYQLIDVLIVDDIQFFARAEKTQDAFFAIFNHLHQSGKQLILTSDKAPKDLDGVQERLLSRFRWGLSADIQIPDFETRMEILEMKMRNDGLEMPKEVVKYVAYNIQTNVRELEGALISLLAQSSLNRKEIDLELAKRVLKSFVKTSSKEITIESIQKMVCEYFDVPYDKLLQKTRKREIVQARQITMYLAKSFTKNSLKTIGEHFGGRDHTTVIHSCQTVKDLMDTDNNFRDSVIELQQKVQLAAM